MKRRIVKTLSVLCTVALLLSTMTFLSGIAAGPQLPEFVPDGWCKIVRVDQVEVRNDNTFVIHATTSMPMNDNDVQLGDGSDGENDFNIEDIMGFYQKLSFYITFPDEGGFHLRTLEDAEASGFFEPSGLQTITVTENGSNKRIEAANGTALIYTQTATGFTLDVLSADNTVVQTVSSEGIEVAHSSDKGFVGTRISLPLREDEAIYNGSERFNAVNQVGNSFSLWNTDACYHDDEDDSSNHTNSYINVPLFHSSDGYSIWYDMTYAATADVGDTDESVFSVEFQGKNLDFYMWSGTILENIKKYTAITGTSIVPEEWVFGYWLGATSSAWTNGEAIGEDYDENLVDTHYKTSYENLVALFDGYKDKLGITDFAGTYMEGANFKFNQHAYDFVKDRGSRVMIWYTPLGYKWQMGWYLPNWNDNDYPFPLRADNPVAGNYSYDTSNGIHTWDFTHPKAFDAAVGFLTNGTESSTRLRPYIEWGAQASLLDFGEYIEPDALCYNGRTGIEMHNRISYDYAKVFVDAWDSMKLNGQQDGYVLFQRSGTAGTQSLVGQFLGDQNRSFNGLKDQLHALISMGMGGFNIYSGDINGHMGDNGSEELYIRWLQLGTFNPLMRTQGNRLPSPWDWNNDGEGANDINAKEIFPDYYWLRMNIQDAVYSAAIDANKTANPMVQAMGVAYQDQKAMHNIDDQYMFLNNLLVAPMTDASTSRNVTLPEGNWYDWFTGERKTGGTTIIRNTPLEEMPLYLKSGAALAVELPKSMKLMESMSDVDDVDADTNTAETYGYKGLVITPPDNLTNNVVYDDQENVTTYTSKYVTPYLFTVNADKASNRKMVIAYGVDAKTIKVDGVPLEKRNAVPDVTKDETGYYTEGNCTYIVAGADWNKLTVENTVATENTVAVNVGESSGNTMEGGLVYVTPQGDTPDEDGNYTFTVTVEPDVDDGYQLKAGSLLFTDVNGVQQVPVNAARHENGAGDTYIIKTKVSGTLAAQFIRPDKTIVNFGCIGTEYTTDMGGGLRFIYRLPRCVNGDKQQILLNGEWKTVKDYGLLVAVDQFVGNQRLDHQLKENSPYKDNIKQISILNDDGAVLYDSSDAYVDFSVKVYSLCNIVGGTTLNLTANGYVQLEDGTYLYANSYTNNFADASSPAA